MTDIADITKLYNIESTVKEKTESTVYEVTVNKTKSIKILKAYPISMFNPESVTKFLSEINKITTIKRPKILKYEKAFKTDKHIIIVMPKCNLNIQSVNPVSYFKDIGVDYIMEQLCECLSHLHSRDMMHGNIKPSNIFINEENTIFLNDYSISILYSGKESVIQKTVEDIQYLTPESLSDRKVGKYSDLWNVGCVLYYLISGKHPFTSKSMEEMKKSIIQGRYGNIKWKYSDYVNPLIKKLLAIDENKRININQLIEELNELRKNIFPKVEIDPSQIPNVPTLNDSFQLPSSFKSTNSDDIIFLPTSGPSTPAPVRFNDNSKHISLNIKGGINESQLYEMNDPTITDSPAPTFSRHIASGKKVVVESPMSDESDSVFSLPSSVRDRVNHNEKDTSYNQMYNEGVRLKNEKNHKDAIESFKNALNIASRNEEKAECNEAIADCYFRGLKNSKESMNYYIESLKYETNDHIKRILYESLGYIYKTQNNYNESIKYYEQALKLSTEKKKKFSINKNIADIYYTKKKEYKGCEKYYLDAIKNASSDEEKCNCYMCLAYSMSKTGKYKEAANNYKLSAQLIKDDDRMKCDMYRRAGDIFYFRLNSYNDAYNNYLWAKKYGTDEEKGNLFRQMGICFFKMDNYAESNKHFLWAIKYLHDEAKAEIYYLIGNNYRKLNHVQSAIDNYKLALKYEKDKKMIGNLYKLIGNTYFYQSDDYKSAIDNYNIAVQYKLDKDDLREIYKCLGYSYNKRNKYDDAINAYNECLKRVTTGEEKGEIYRRIGQIYIDKKQYDDALKYNQWALKYVTESEDKGILNRIVGDIYLNKGQCNFAMKYYSLALVQDISDNDKMKICTKLGDYHCSDKNYEEAISQYIDALNYADTDEERNDINLYLSKAYYNLGASYLKNDDYDNAISNYESSIEYATEDDLIRKANKAIADIYQYLKKYKEAVKFFKATLEYVGNSRDDMEMKKTIYNTLVKDYLALKLYSEVERSLRNVLNYMKSDVEKAGIYKMVGDNYYNNKMYDEAIKNYKIAIDYEKDNDTKKSMYMFMGNAYNNMKEYDDAINSYQLGVKCASGNDKGNFYYKIANIYYFSLKSYDKCIEAYKSCLKYSFDDNTMKNIYMYLGNAYSLIKNYETSIKYLKEAVPFCNTAKDVSDTHKKIGISYYGNKQYKEALEYFNKMDKHDLPTVEKYVDFCKRNTKN